MESILNAVGNTLPPKDAVENDERAWLAGSAMARTDRTAYLLLLAMAVCFGGTWVAGKVAVEEVPPATVAAARFALATLLLLAWARTRNGALRRPGLADLPLVAGLGLTAIAGYNLLFLYGLKLAPASDGAIIVPGVAPVLTAALAWLLLGERIGARGAPGFVLAGTGLVLVVDPAGGVDPGRLAGALLFILGAACWGAYSILGKTATARFDTVTATLYGTAAGTLMLLPLSYAAGGWADLAGASLKTWASVGYLAVFGTVLAFVLFYEGVKRIGPSRAASFTLLVPLFGILGAVLLLHEQLGLLTVAGAGAVLGGLWLAQHPGAGERTGGAAGPSPAMRRTNQRRTPPSSPVKPGSPFRALEDVAAVGTTSATHVSHGLCRPSSVASGHVSR